MFTFQYWVLKEASVLLGQHISDIDGSVRWNKCQCNTAQSRVCVDIGPCGRQRIAIDLSQKLVVQLA